MKKNPALPDPSDLAVATTETVYDAIPIEPLSPEEESRRKKLEAIVRKHSDSFVPAEEALWHIKEEKLYRSTHSSFESYCRESFKFTASWANRQVNRHRVNMMVGEMSENQSGANGTVSESVARLLQGLSDYEAEEALKKAFAKSKGAKPSPEQMGDAVAKVKKQTKKQRIKELEGLLAGLSKGGQASATLRKQYVTELADLKDEAPSKEDRPALKARLTLEEIRVEIDSWVKSLRNPNKTQPIKKTAATIKELFV